MTDLILHLIDLTLNDGRTADHLNCRPPELPIATVSEAWRRFFDAVIYALTSTLYGR